MAKQNEQAIRDFIALNHYGVLSTISVKKEGFPFGSLVPYDITESGEIIIYISLIAQHYKNLKSNNSAGLFVMDSSHQINRQADSRVSIQIKFEELADDEAESAKTNYLKRFPNSINYEIAHNFKFMKGAVQSLRWIGGFGSMGWIEAEAFNNCSHDNVAYEALPALQHMNEDHEDALINYVNAFTDVDAANRSAKLSLICSEFFEVVLADGESRERVKIPFERKLESASELHGVMVELAGKARELLQK